jgi:hypothetical protein
VGHAVEQRAVELVGLGEELLALAGGAQLLALDQLRKLVGEALGKVALGEGERRIRAAS